MPNQADGCRAGLASRASTSLLLSPRSRAWAELSCDAGCSCNELNVSPQFTHSSAQSLRPLICGKSLFNVFLPISVITLIKFSFFMTLKTPGSISPVLWFLFGSYLR